MAVAERLSPTCGWICAARRDDRKEKEAGDPVRADSQTMTCPECGYEFVA